MSCSTSSAATDTQLDIDTNAGTDLSGAVALKKVSHCSTLRVLFRLFLTTKIKTTSILVIQIMNPPKYIRSKMPNLSGSSFSNDETNIYTLHWIGNIYHSKSYFFD